ncbi:ATP-binding protein [Fibrella forsythiae]|uniref:Oxygen sensor histidine kinase NreB n=1 Tax=Fibrella forsythiae TaxID=2817061 RepID=A0ABS3JMM3_9BACT|nr:ATP-binding protein [Fibrella forsythiae]MBO0951243.1 hypothetical protein [Fibrella forsythiae]
MITRFASLLVLLLWGRMAVARQPEFTRFWASNGLQDSSFTLGKPIRLNYRQTHLRISFRDRNSSPATRYAYRLVGEDPRWYDNGGSESVSYANLFGGQYRFEVKNMANPLKVSSLSFELEEAFWQRTWFVPMLVGYGLLVAGVILYLVMLYKLRGRLRLQQLRNAIAADLHDDVGSTLSTISFLGELAKRKFPKQPEASLPLLEKMVDEAHQMVQTMRGMVWTISPGNDNATDFLEKVRSFVSTMLNSRDISLTFKHDVPERDLLSVEQQRHLFLIIKEITHNIAKHANARHVTFYARKHEQFLWIGVTDDGIGFTVDTSGEGNGLQNMQKRVAELDGKLEIESANGQGTIIRLMIPL